MTPGVGGDQPSFIINITRYGLPLVIGIFYLTASLGFEFTADSAMQMASVVKLGFASSIADGYASPQWQFLLMLGGWFHLDPLLTSKVLSLVFSCLVVFASYFVANEILRDRLIAFCVSLVLAMQGWLLQIAPSGSALSMAIALTLTALFFMLRNEYVVAPFLLGLCTLVYWQTAFLLIPLCVDIWINSVSKRRASKVMLSGCLVYLSALMPFGLYAWINNVAAIPVLFRIVELPALSLLAVAVLVFLGTLGVAGFVFSLLMAETRLESVRTNVGTLLFMIVLAFSGWILHLDVWYAAIPFIVVYAFFGLAEMLKRMAKERLLYSAVFVLTGLLLILFQMDYYRGNKPSMAAAISQTTELRIAAEWIKMRTSSGQRVCAERPGVLEYYSERPVAPLNPADSLGADFVITSQRDVTGYEVAFQPEVMPDPASVHLQHSAVWRRK
jgi:hypothetical protein